MAHNPECGLDCVSAGAVRGQPAQSASQSTGRQHLSGDQSAEQATVGDGYITALIRIALSSNATADELRGIARWALKWSEVEGQS
jgi:hypothetical protein